MAKKETPGKKKSKEVQLLVSMFFEEEFHAKGELKTLDERDANYLLGVNRAAEKDERKDKWPLKIHKHGDPAPLTRTHLRRQKQRDEHLAMLGLHAKTTGRGAGG